MKWGKPDAWISFKKCNCLIVKCYTIICLASFVSVRWMAHFYTHFLKHNWTRWRQHTSWVIQAVIGKRFTDMWPPFLTGHLLRCPYGGFPNIWWPALQFNIGWSQRHRCLISQVFSKWHNLWCHHQGYRKPQVRHTHRSHNWHLKKISRHLTHW